MRRLLAWCGALMLLVPTVGCSDDYDDSKLWQNIDDLKARLEALEKQVGQMNGEIGALRKLVDESVTVVRVEQHADGYTIYFSDNTTATIRNGENGADGRPGSDGKPGADGRPGADAPVIGVKQDTDGVWYWTITTDGRTEWLLADGQKLRVTGEGVTPLIAVDAEGYWTISFDGGTTSERILDAEGNPVSALAQEGSGGGSLFVSVTEDGNNVYFELRDGTILTVPLRSDFYMLIRKAPEVATFVYGETRTYEVEAVGVQKTVVTKPDEWKVAYAEGLLTITAPTEAHKDCADREGAVSIIYFSANGQSDAVTMGVVVEADMTGETVGKDFTVDITEITDTKLKADITPADASMRYYVSTALKSEIDANGTDNLLNHPTNGLLSMLYYYNLYGMIDYYAQQGAVKNWSPTFNCKAGTDYYLLVFGFEVDSSAATLATEPMLVPFRTKQPVVINTVYRINVSDIGWYTARYTSVPSDDRTFLHGLVKKSEFEAHETDAVFMEAYVKRYRDYYYDELLIDKTVTWEMLASTSTQTVVAPSYREHAQLADYIDGYVKPLLPDTEYYAVSFAVEQGEPASPLSKAAFRTAAFKPSEACTFRIEASVEGQDITVTVTPSDKRTSYVCVIARSAYYREFESDLQYAADDVFWTKLAAEEAQKPFGDYLFSGDQTLVARNNWAATGYEICVYGCTADGVITTEPVLTHVVTQGTVDTAAPAAGGRRAAKTRGYHFE